MTKAPKSKPQAQQPQSSQPLVPRDVIDGIPDRAAKRPLWKFIAIAVVFLCWVAFLIYCLLPEKVAFLIHWLLAGGKN